MIVNLGEIVLLETALFAGNPNAAEDKQKIDVCCAHTFVIVAIYESTIASDALSMAHEIQTHKIEICFFGLLLITAHRMSIALPEISNHSTSTRIYGSS